MALTLEEVVSLFPDVPPSKIHQYDLCKLRDCSDISKEEHNRIKEKRNREKFHHHWLGTRSEVTGVCWPIYIEGEGFFCIHCKIHRTENKQNKDKIFSQEPCVRIKEQAIKSHGSETIAHSLAESQELLKRGSIIHKKVEHNADVKHDVYYNAFYSIYWIMSHAVANRNVKSLLSLLEEVHCEIKSFNHNSPSSHREIMLLIAKQIKDKVLEDCKEGMTFGLLVDDMSDVTSMEQMIVFVQYYSRKEEKVSVKFLRVENVLAEAVSADSETLTKLLCKTLEEDGLDIKKLSGMASDGAAVMLGSRNGVGKRMKEKSPNLIVIHCVCHRLALACADSNQELQYLKSVVDWLTQLWKLFEYSNKKLAAFIKTQINLINLKLLGNVKKKTAKKLKKACKTRWLSTESSVKSAIENYSAIVQTLMQLESACATSAGLLKKCNTGKFLSTLFILNDILPILANISRSFQKSVVNFSRIKPCLEYAKAELEKLASSQTSEDKFREEIHQLEERGLLQFNMKDSVYTDMTKLKKKYIASLVTHIDERFRESTPLIGAFAVFDPMLVPNDVNDYGSEEIEVIAHHFFKETDEKAMFKAEWGKFKFDMKEWKKSFKVTPDQSPTEWCLQRILQMRSCYGPMFPCLSYIAEVILSLPVSNAWPERGASKIKLIKSRLRNRMKNDLLNGIMQVHLNGPQMFSKECKDLIQTSVKEWLKQKKRRNVAKSSGEGDHREFNSSSVEENEERAAELGVDAETQTAEMQDIEKEKEAEEEQQALVDALFGLDGDGKGEYQSDDSGMESDDSGMME